MNDLRSNGSDLMVFHVLDPAELAFPFDQPGNFEDLESGERVQVIPEYLRGEYRELVDEHIATLSRLMGENRIDYHTFDTSQPLDYALFSYLSRREKMSRVH